ncbi:DUF397 domain-containing protein [Streptomyces griseocarneus]|uniref:DUF397 domain-containing protein n=1 Tax=Streptomyces griseocarneus TaxID=51201 RepID=UPI00167F0CEE|nr:DUF397 domain-containing protein [Streptomyces griseocarneus]MBZ6473107.1 DUF397 domain-containing protein [Streptomyces griseocarneus]GHG59906.1 hypothetical protein GCM10018779_26710 [Streptomyces griseocarneus]
MRSEIIWQKSSYSGGGNNCVEIANRVDGVALRESTAPGTVLTTTPPRFRALLAHLRRA